MTTFTLCAAVHPTMEGVTCLYEKGHINDHVANYERWRNSDKCSECGHEGSAHFYGEGEDDWLVCEAICEDGFACNCGNNIGR